MLKNSGRVSHDSLNTYLAECSHIDYSISIDSDQVIVLKLRFETEKIFRIKEDENIFEIFDERFPSTPTSIVSRFCISLLVLLVCNLLREVILLLTI